MKNKVKDTRRQPRKEIRRLEAQLALCQGEDDMRVKIVETGDDWMETAGWAESEASSVADARAVVAREGWRVMPDSEGGDCHLFATTDDAYYVVTVYPEP